MAHSRAVELATKLKQGPDADQIIETEGLELERVESFLRGGIVPQAGPAAAVTEAAFSLPLKDFSDPVPTNNGFVLLRVVERTGFSLEQFDSEKDGFAEQILNEKRQQIWSAYMQGLQRRYSVQRNRELLRQLTG